MKLEWAEISAAIVERVFHAALHAIQVILMSGMVVNLQVHIFPMVPHDLVASRVHGEKAQNGGIALVVEVPSAVRGPFLLQIAGDDRDLVGAGADRGIQVDPV